MMEGSVGRNLRNVTWRIWIRFHRLSYWRFLRNWIKINLVLSTTQVKNSEIFRISDTYHGKLAPILKINDRQSIRHDRQRQRRFPRQIINTFSFGRS